MSLRSQEESKSILLNNFKIVKNKAVSIVEKFFPPNLGNKGCFYGFDFLNRIKEGFVIYNEEDAKSICDYYVKSQKLFINEKNRELINSWSSNFYLTLNLYLRNDVEIISKQSIVYDTFSNALNNLIESTDGLKDDVVLFRGEKNVDLNRFIVGEICSFDGFISTSFSRNVGLKFTKSHKSDKNNYLIIIHAKKGTKGIAINGRGLGEYSNQSEWLLNDKTKYITKDIDKLNKQIFIELI